MTLPHGIEDVHVDRLKLYLPKLQGNATTLHYFQPQQAVPEDDTYVVEQILGHRVRHGKLQWRVRWKGYDSSHDSWEPTSCFTGYVQAAWVKYNKDNNVVVPMKEWQ